MARKDTEETKRKGCGTRCMEAEKDAAAYLVRIGQARAKEAALARAEQAEARLPRERDIAGAGIAEIPMVATLQSSQTIADAGVIARKQDMALSTLSRRMTRLSSFSIWRPFVTPEACFQHDVCRGRRKRNPFFCAGLWKAATAKSLRPLGWRSRWRGGPTSSWSGLRPVVAKATRRPYAASAFSGIGPGAMLAFSALIPPRIKSLRQSRTVSSHSPNAWAIRPPARPSSVNRTARARSAPARSTPPAKAFSAAFCSSVAVTGDLPTMSYPRKSLQRRNHNRHLLARPINLLRVGPGAHVFACVAAQPERGHLLTPTNIQAQDFCYQERSHSFSRASLFRYLLPLAPDKFSA